MTRAGLAAGAATALTRLFLLAYPSSFRRDVGEAIVADVRRRASEMARSRSGIWGVAWLVRLGVSLAANGFGAWADKIGSTAFSRLDLKLAVRMLVKYPGLTLTGGLGIAVAIAIGVGFFAVLHSRFYPTIPLNEGDRLVGLENWDRRTSRENRRSLHDFTVWRTEMKSVEDMAAFRTAARNVIADDGSVEGVEVAEITPSGFRLARVPPLLGRTLLEADAAADAAPVVVIGFDVWRARFVSAPDIVGRPLRLGRAVHTIVGVMPEEFAFPVNHRYWIPLTAEPSNSERGKGPSVFIAGRLASGFELSDANAELTVIGDRMAAQFPDTHRNLRPEVLPYTYPFAGMSTRSSDGFWLMSVLVSLLLVVVCVNVAILIYARTATRLGEIAVRTALGASRARIVAQLFAESLVLSGVAAVSGLMVVALGLDWARASMAGLDQSSFWTDYSLSGTSLVYFAVLTVLASVITGVIPALRATGRHVESDLRRFNSGAGLRLGRTWTTLIVVQVSVACAAIPIAVALGWLQLRDIFSVPTFPVEQVLFARVGLDQEPQLPARFAALQMELSRRIAAEPGVVSHAFTLGIPTIGSDGRVTIEGEPPAAPGTTTRDVLRSTVDLDFFRTFDADLLAGRGFRADDGAASSADVVVVNRAFAVRVLGNGDPLGRRFRFDPDQTSDPGEPAPQRRYEIVGVVENTDANPFGQDLVDPRVYHPMRNADGIGVGLAVKTTGTDHGSLARKLRQTAASLDPTLRVDVVPLGEAYRVRRVTMTTAAMAIGVALLSVILMSAAGIYALMSFTVAQRRREIAIRTALGAQPGRLLRGIFGQALRKIAVGVVLGVGVALLIDLEEGGEALRGNGALLLSGTALVMSLVGLLAALGPARRGLRIEPSEALKAQ